MNDVARAAETAARASYGRLLAYLAARSRDIALAEDALAEAFARALTRWPIDGVPGNPDGWLLTVARNQMTDRHRHAARFPTTSEIPDTPADPDSGGELPDQRLALMMVCAHPAIASDLHTPLMLQTVLGMDAKHIAQLFLISPSALAKRLVRAKAKIRDAGIPFTIPDTQALPDRRQSVFEAIYALNTADWIAPSEAMGEEALYLADLLTRLMPDDAEARGLAALISFGHARRDARLSDGVLVPIETQNADLWDMGLIGYGLRQLTQAKALDQMGRFQIEAAIQSVHLARRHRGEIDWGALARLYHALCQIAPSAGAQVAQASVVARLHGPRAGLAALDDIENSVGQGFQPLWAARADMLRQANQPDAALPCYDKAISLATDAPLIRFLKMRRAQVAQM